jgi:hypothetical protein|tara:strand:+ start:1123 stop:1284 length:162 start_codon:yes stop_codon:yes gene_type:complete
LKSFNLSFVEFSGKGKLLHAEYHEPHCGESRLNPEQIQPQKEEQLQSIASKTQ